ncbi:thioredoxin family protein [Flavobacterium sp.]|uniref:thioredoxin family protein n=1 Tax=Flavobacterium sp. TaxID=239 RepID=UPI000ED64F42|nr:thioredoxin family protein [Flavobacterium sp.]HCQ13255.1 thioredoxin family protein [Flavobacterium sp.]
MKKFGIVALLALVVMSFSTLPAGYKVGDKATDFKLKSVDGKMYSMADYKDAKGFIVVFTCNHCPFAVKYEDRIVALAKKYKSLGYELIAINPNDPAAQPEDSFDLMKVRAKEKGFTFPYLFDEGQKVYPQYGATKTPHVFLLDKSLIVKYIGAIDDNVDDAAAVKERYLENAIAALEKNQEANPSMTKAIGCSIKVKK